MTCKCPEGIETIVEPTNRFVHGENDLITHYIFLEVIMPRYNTRDIMTQETAA